MEQRNAEKRKFSVIITNAQLPSHKLYLIPQGVETTKMKQLILLTAILHLGISIALAVSFWH